MEPGPLHRITESVRSGFSSLPRAPASTIPRRQYPARAGSISASGSSSSGTRDHPRTRGEHVAIPSRARRPPGPPPAAQLHGQEPGTTPARAGSTSRPGRWSLTTRDHPRTRGEHAEAYIAESSCRGPPPHARGARRPHRGEHQPAGTTPARAGSTAPGWWACRRRRDHPRTRGEHCQAPIHSSVLTGPPPHARGARPIPLQLSDGRGTTPARAGSTVRDLGF